MKTKAWKRMASGKYVDLNDMRPDDFDIEDVNTSLNHLIRFNGHFKDVPPLTVAQHTQLCVDIAKTIFPGDTDTILGCIVHDFGETYYGDITTPVKKAMGETYRTFADPIDKMINDKFIPRIDWPAVEDRVKICDLLSLDVERRVMWGSQRGKDKWPEPPLNLGTLIEKEEMFHMVAEGPVDLRRLLEMYT